MGRSGKISPRYNNWAKKISPGAKLNGSVASGTTSALTIRESGLKKSGRNTQSGKALPSGKTLHMQIQEMNSPTQQEGSAQIDREPTQILYLEVNLGKNHQEKLIICEGDNADLSVQTFSRKHGLSEDKQRRLMQVVQDQLASLLPRILEEDGAENPSPINTRNHASRIPQQSSLDEVPKVSANEFESN